MTSLHTISRPQAFSEVLGHEKVISSLRKVIADKRAHTFIFTGPSGVGKTTLARILANEFANGKATVANIDEVDGATNSGADAMRAVVTRAYYRAVGASSVKTIVIDEAHRLSTAAWTILLKPVEEPPPHVYWVFCTTDAGKIPKTIETRCLRYDLKPVSEEDIYLLLKRVSDTEGLNVNDDILECLAEGSGGSPRQALVFLEECVHITSVADARNVMRGAGQSKEIIDLCRFLAGNKGRTWPEALKYLNALQGTDPENIRIVYVNYMKTKLLNSKDPRSAAVMLGQLEPWLTPWEASTGWGNLLLAVGFALNLDK